MNDRASRHRSDPERVGNLFHVIRLNLRGAPVIRRCLTTFLGSNGAAAVLRLPPFAKFNRGLRYVDT